MYTYIHSNIYIFECIYVLGHDVKNVIGSGQV